MDKFARIYAWFLLVTSGMAAVARLAGAQQMARVNSERLDAARKRNRHRLIGIAVAIASLALVPVYLLYARGQSWMPVAAGVGVLSGLEFVINAARSHPSALRRQNLVFGALFAVATLAVYWVLFR